MIFKPKIIDTLKQYDRKQFVKDLWAGVVVGIVALPLAIAFSIASGLSPEKGLFTAVIAGFIISALGGSRVQIGGPTGAAYKFKDAMRLIEKPPRVLIIRMRRVPIIDATGLRVLREVCKESTYRATKLILTEVHSSQVMRELKESRLLFTIGKANITDNLMEAI